MKNIPIFTGEHGTATLIFHEIPYSGRAYVIIRSVWEDRTAAFLEECRQFCRAAGARESYISWKLADLPAVHAYDMLTMACEKSALPWPPPRGVCPGCSDPPARRPPDFAASLRRHKMPTRL